MRIIKNIVNAPAGISELNNIIIKNDVPVCMIGSSSVVIRSVAVGCSPDNPVAKAVTTKSLLTFATGLERYFTFFAAIF